MDGYFPSELQARFPDGVPLEVSFIWCQMLVGSGSAVCLPQVTDRRDVMFRERQYADVFPGAGPQLGGWQGPSKLVPSSTQLRGRQKETTELPG